jgi:hypothetical protein
MYLKFKKAIITLMTESHDAYNTLTLKSFYCKITIKFQNKD